ncbi:poly-gamma-glutamate biosynthesis protein PgsC/CapC [Salsuginibacillus halophilus]|uniref:Poly-gamma-glutamate biosynthesis protein PgsC/CapC n=1 Tax=Salsuginibacillus halophilus TaxID=517424 RepID=A0A2P8H908_9BACI|nr:poly-gamma-glutamate biosynthesis protein PgsC [Salsuginibacillus halophilus]PSL42717.1 poly-gamma-glutamate biosynthesis protein PgsC/CapC [Salsuginibacillus halophilus]
MFGDDLYVALIIGIVLSLIYTERTGVLPSGLIVPGYVALVFDQQMNLVVIGFISISTFLIVQYVLNRFVILYGRRKFAAMLSVGIVLKLIYDFFALYLGLPIEESFELRGIGIIVPGLIANTVHKQGVLPTIGSTYLLGGLTYFGLMFYLLFLI